MSSWSQRGERFGALLGVDEPWERQPGPRQFVEDARIAGVFAVLAVCTLELVRSLGLFDGVDLAVWQQYGLVLVGLVPLLVRRRFPLSVAVASQAHFFAVAVLLPSIAYQLVFQFLCFFGLYSGVAWARDRRALIVVIGGVLVFMSGWLAWDFSLGNSIAKMTQDATKHGAAGLMSPAVAWVFYSVLINVVFFGGAILLGQNAWRSARRSALIVEQAETIAAQASELADHAVVQERLRIARELHDVVAHHVSVIGVQAAAARRVLTKRPEAAAQALGNIENASRQAVGEMRALLGTLRSGADAQSASREPGPGIGELAALVEHARSPGFAVGYELVEEPSGAADDVPAPMALSLYRIVQEALANVRRHSSANRVGVVVRVRRSKAAAVQAQGGCGGYVEAEVVDNGRPLGSTSGTGLGQLGMRERIASHRGTVETGPRLAGGYRVRVRFPLPQNRSAEVLSAVPGGQVTS
ncbi:MAG: histidine kinase [Micrococcales bacterium]|nr:histidine kinase [Micrococcales bacterium]